MGAQEIVELLKIFLEQVHDFQKINWPSILIGAIVQLFVGLIGVYIGYLLAVGHSAKRARLRFLKEIGVSMPTSPKF